MALKVDRYERFVSTDFFMSETGEAGSVVVFDPASTGLGASLDDVNAQVILPNVANGSGEALAGLLVGDVVNKNLTQTHLNQHKRETQVGGKVGVARDGIWVTNRVASGSTPSPGVTAYFTVEGLLTDSSVLDSPRVGTFLSGVDADGYVKVEINIVNPAKVN